MDKDGRQLKHAEGNTVDKNHPTETNISVVAVASCALAQVTQHLIRTSEFEKRAYYL